MSRTIAPSAGQSTPVRSFAIQAMAFLVIFTALVFVGIFWRIFTLIQQSVIEQASSYADLIVDARAWNASHSEVWVLKTAESPTNPYLRMLGVEPDTSTVSGTQLTMRNPAAMTQEISKIAAVNDRVTFRLTSLKPINPADAPDAWQREQLERFTTDPSQVTRAEQRDGIRVLHLMRPLVTEESCLRCHGQQGYRVGDIRGALSVVVPLASADAALRKTGYVLMGIFALVLAVGIAIGYALISRLAERLNKSDEMLRVAATTDPLTGVSNRRAVFERLEEELARSKRRGSSLGVIIMDIDHFKQVNDEHGHVAGDAVLRELTTRLSAGLREYDLLGRIGGEEFLVVAPETGHSALMHLAERLRIAVAETPVVHGELSIPLTVSAGLAVARSDDTPDSLVVRADIAMYGAKGSGRNRTESG